MPIMMSQLLEDPYLAKMVSDRQEAARHEGRRELLRLQLEKRFGTLAS